MNKLVLAAGMCGAVALAAVAAQERMPDRGRPMPMSRLALALDANHDGTISADELRAAPAALKALDANGDGRITPDEVRPAFGPGGPGERRGEPGRGPDGRDRRERDGDEHRGPEGARGPGGPGGERGGPPAMGADDLVDTLMAFDRNTDGTLTRDEVPERFQGLFDRADGNKDGKLTRDEIKASAAQTMAQGPGGGPRGERGPGGPGGPGMGRGGPGGFDPLFRALDTNQDGVISADELAAATTTLKSLDANHDGQLSADETRPAPPRRGPGHDAGDRR